jgi:NAD(P)-dependent dehydrogenase (short-subunit alcohol dehydrogenase family)
VAFVRCDVGSADDNDALVRKALETFGGLDIAVNNAGISGPIKTLVETDFAAWKKTFAVNVDGVFLGMRSQIPVCRVGTARRKCRTLHEAAGADFGAGRQVPDQRVRVPQLPVRPGSRLRGAQQRGTLTEAGAGLAILKKRRLEPVSTRGA